MRSPVVLRLLSCIQLCHSVSWPYNIPRDIQYHPQDEQHIQRELQSQEKLAWQKPMGVKRMSEDEGEKFFLQYWSFEALSNTSMSPALARHTNHDRISGLFTRDFKCPGMTNACSDVDSPLCCPNGQSCVRVDGAVGCCPDGQTCGGDVAECDTSAGYKSCPGSSEGGCCIPGAECQDGGCVFYGTATVTQIYTTAVQPKPTSASRDTTTVTVTTTVGGQVTTITRVSTVVVGAVCSSGFSSCAASLGGGCCPNDRTCGNDGSCIGSSASAPIRPTSVTDTITGAAAASTTTANDFCPTGFYMCEARYLGGCCRVGRDCQTTSCPSTASTTVVSSGATVLVPVATGASAAGSCPNGWAGCPADSGGGCCPSGYLCGQSCTATVNGQENTGKLAPSQAASLIVVTSFVVVAITAVVGTIIL